MELAADPGAWSGVGALSWLQLSVRQALDFCQSTAGSASSTGGGSRGSREGRCCSSLWDICMPTYQATNVDVLEERRLNMGLALLGQLSVVTFRLLSGHVGGAAVGLCIFVLGNRARCSLHSFSLTAYVMLGAGFAVADLMGLMQEMLTHGTTFVAFPLGDNIIQDLSAVSLVLAPVVEVGGACVAWESYLDPSMLFTDRGDGSCAMMRGPPVNVQQQLAQRHTIIAPPMGGIPYIQRGCSWPPEALGKLGPAVLIPEEFEWEGSPPPRQESGLWSWLPGGFKLGWGEESHEPGPPWHRPPSSRQSSEAGSSHFGHRSSPPEPWGAWNLRAASSHDAVLRSPGLGYGPGDNVTGRCAQCGCVTPLGLRWRGSGAYVGKLYCEACWADWSIGKR